MKRIYINFLRGLSVNLYGKIGVILATSMFLSFIVLETLSFMGVYNNAYMGLITYLAFPSLFILGLILVVIGWKKFQKQQGRSTRELLIQRVGTGEARAKLMGSRVFLMFLGLSAVNVIFVVGASSRMLHFMDSSEFCGMACHSIMGPEYLAYQSSSHARVPCVECHVGHGISALIESKVAGTRQMIKASMNTYNRPVQTPVHNLRPSNETCEKCHWPEKYYGRTLKHIVHYEQNEKNTPLYTTLSLKVDAQAGIKTGIHWHISKDNEVRYASVDNQREQIIWIETKDKTGTTKRYQNKLLDASLQQQTENRLMDCVDCHNRATHHFQSAEDEIDQAIKQGQIDHNLPFIKREGLAVLNNNLTTKQQAFDFIETHITNFYSQKYSTVSMKRVDEAIRILQKIYNRNIHPEMKITWNTYVDHSGHKKSTGCFRCHSESLVDENGEHLANDCTMCHSILADSESDPFAYLNPLDPNEPEMKKHLYLQEEFKNSYQSH
jgi:nitrate/TMAO reductase-like tetraheme cytochrome c subunit